MSTLLCALLLAALQLLPAVTAQHKHRKVKIVTPLQNATIAAGDDFVFSCAAHGTPKPGLVINRQEEGIHGLRMPDKNHRDVKGTTTAKRRVESAVPSDEGWYKCYAINQRNLDTSAAYLTVRAAGCHNCAAPKQCLNGVCTCERSCPAVYSPVCASNCKTYFGQCQMSQQACNKDIQLEVISAGICPKIEPPRAVAESTEVNLYPGESVVLSVAVSGTPAPDVDWYQIVGNKRRYIGEGERVSVTQEGEYVAQAVNCLSNAADSDVIRVVEVELTEGIAELNAQPDLNEKSCSILGDAHIISFDNWMYNFDGSCTYVLAMDCDYASWFVYIRYQTCDTGRCLESVSIISGRSQIQLFRGWVINDGGKKLSFKKDKEFRVQGMRGFYDGNLLTITVQNSVRVVFDGYAVVQVHVPETANTCGLCGNNDGVSDNDVQSGRRNYQTAKDAVNFVESWRLRSGRECTATQDTELNMDRATGSCTTDKARKSEFKNCRKLYSLQSANRCVGNKELRFLYDACRYDACFGEEPLPGFSNVCQTAQAISNVCSQTEVDSQWEEKLGCENRVERLNGIIGRGCPQTNILPM